MKAFLIATLAWIVSAPVVAAPPVTALAVSPDGNWILAGSQAGLEVRKYPTLESNRTLAVDMPNIHDLAFSPDGKRLAIGGGSPGRRGIVTLLSWPDGKVIWNDRSHRDCVYHVSWRSDSAEILTASADATCQVIQSTTGKVVRTLEGHSGGVLAAAFLPGKAEIVSGGLDSTLRVWDAHSGAAIRTMTNHTQAITDLSVRLGTAGPSAIVSAGNDRTVRLWQPSIGRLVRFVRLESIPQAVAWSNRGERIIAACKDGRVRILDPESMAIMETIDAIDGVAYCLTTAPDGVIVVGGENGLVKRVEPVEPIGNK